MKKALKKAGFLPSNKCLDFFLKNHLIFTPWQYVAKRSTFIKGQISFPVGRHYEDDATTYKVIYYSETVSFLKKPLYYYLHRNDSIMGKNKNGFTPVELYQMHLSFYEMCDFIKRNSLLSTYKYACEYYFTDLSSAYLSTKFDNQKERKLLGKVKHSLIYFSFKCSFKGQITIKRKIKLVLFRLGLISYARFLKKIIHRKEGCARS